MNSLNNPPLILEIKGHSLDDGPGIRSVIFFKGCPLSCVWCHNPESKSPKKEIAYDKKECIGCLHCIDVCPNKAITLNHPFYVDRHLCDLCFECVFECPTNAMSQVGHEMCITDILQKVLIYKPFYETSGGGVTLSGGEPTLNILFASELIKELRLQGIHVLLETCGHFSYDKFKEFLLPNVNTVYFDLKLMNEEKHKTCCGVSNSRIIDNFKSLAKDAEKTSTELLPRVPLVPGITDTKENLQQIALFLKENDISKVSLMSYNPLWHEKCEKIGRKNPLAQEPSMTTWMDSKHIQNCQEIFLQQGIQLY